MNEPVTIQADIYEDSAFVIMARLVGATNTALVQADISTITYTVTNTTTGAAVTNHSAASLTVSSVIVDTLSTSNGWKRDSTGYNFRHVVAGTALPTGGDEYVYEAIVTLTSGNAFPVVAEIHALPLSRS